MADLVPQKTYFRPHNQSPNPATVCVNLNDGKKLIAQVTNMWDSERTLTPDECNGGLDSEVFNCLWGGESTKNGWKFRSVINSLFELQPHFSEPILTNVLRADPEQGRC